jgi:Bacterial TSP3 repeat
MRLFARGISTVFLFLYFYSIGNAFLSASIPLSGQSFLNSKRMYVQLYNPSSQDFQWSIDYTLNWVLQAQSISVFVRAGKDTIWFDMSCDTIGKNTVSLEIRDKNGTKEKIVEGTFSCDRDFDRDGIGNTKDLDDDNDGLADIEEVEYGTDPHNKDTDNDTLLDGGEVINGTNPLKKDTDGDGLEDAHDIFPNDAQEIKDADRDMIGDTKDSDDDNDGLTDILEKNYKTSVHNSDTDGDWLSDGKEIGLWTNPLKKDSDNDGVSDSKDAFPLDAKEVGDQDRDGIGDVADIDDDNDGISDIDEAKNGTNPIVKNDVQIQKNISDFSWKNEQNIQVIPQPIDPIFQKKTQEWSKKDVSWTITIEKDISHYDLRPINNSTKQSQDTDQDGLSDIEEWKRWTDPRLPDTDWDDIYDALDTLNNHRPSIDGTFPTFVLSGFSSIFDAKWTYDIDGKISHVLWQFQDSQNIWEFISQSFKSGWYIVKYEPVTVRVYDDKNEFSERKISVLVVNSYFLVGCILGMMFLILFFFYRRRKEKWKMPSKSSRFITKKIKVLKIF